MSKYNSISIIQRLINGFNRTKSACVNLTLLTVLDALHSGFVQLYYNNNIFGHVCIYMSENIHLRESIINLGFLIIFSPKDSDTEAAYQAFSQTEGESSAAEVILSSFKKNVIHLLIIIIFALYFHC